MTTTTNFVWDSVSDCVLSELDGTNAVQAVYTNEPQQYGGVLSQRRGTTTSTLHADALGTTRVLTSSTQTTTHSYLYDAWGQPDHKQRHNRQSVSMGGTVWVLSGFNYGAGVCQGEDVEIDMQIGPTSGERSARKSDPPHRCSTHA